MKFINSNLGGLFRCSNVLELCYKLEIWYVSTHIYVVSENIPFSTNNPLILLVLAFFFAKNQHFLVKNSTFTQNNSMRAVLEVFQFYFVSFTDHVSNILHLDCSKLAINLKNDNDVTVCQQDTIANFFNVAIFLLSPVIGPSLMSISLLVLEI